MIPTLTTPTDRIDFIHAECWQIEAILKAQTIGCRALSGSEKHHNIDEGDLRAAFDGLAFLLESLEARVRAIAEAADTLAEKGGA